MSRRGSAIFDYVTTRAWMLDLRVLEKLERVVERHIEGVKISDEELNAILEAREAAGRSEPRNYELRGKTAVIPVTGVISRYSRQVNGSSQPRGTSTEAISARLREALGDEGVERIVLRVDSPGGTVDGVAELADEIYAARNVKPITAAIDGGLCCSAAYFIASSAGHVVASKGSTVGSIGVYAAIVDQSRQAKNEGVDVEVIRAGRLKGAGLPGTSMTQDQRTELQALVDSHYDLFTRSVARGRNMPLDRVLQLADGGVHVGQKAKDLGLVDAVGGFEDVVATGDAGAFSVAATAGGGVAASASNQIQDVGTGDQGGLRDDLGSSDTESNMTQDSKAPSAGPLTADDVSKQHPGAAAALLAQGAQTERARIAAIQEMAAKGQESLVAQLIASGADEAAASKALLADLKGRQSEGLSRMIAAAPASAGNVLDKQHDERKATATPAIDPNDIEAVARDRFAKDPAIREEFETVETYIALQKGEAKMRERRPHTGFKTAARFDRQEEGN